MGKGINKWTKQHTLDLSLSIVVALLTLASICITIWNKDMEVYPKLKIISTGISIVCLMILCLINYINIRRKAYTECIDFADSKPPRICHAIRDCIISSNTIKGNGDSHLSQLHNSNELFDNYLDLIKSFLSYYAKGDLKMTLPKSPYDQINNSTLWENMKHTLDIITGKNNEKLIILSPSELNSFITNIYVDFEKREPKSNFENYIIKHAEQNISIEWKLLTNDYTIKELEYLIIGRSIYLEVDNQSNSIKIQFDNIDNNLKVFSYNDLQTNKFLENHVKEEFYKNLNQDSVKSADIKGEIKNNFDCMLKRMKDYKK
jgi:hypothetical protein